jgi:hypothetical protein
MVSARERRIVERRTRMAATGRGMRLVLLLWGVRRWVVRSVMAGWVVMVLDVVDGEARWRRKEEGAKGGAKKPQT